MKTRITFVDTAKFLIVFLVLLSHAPLLIDDAIRVLLSVSQTFFIFYGFVVYKTNTELSLRDKLKKLARRVLIPYLFFSFAYAMASHFRYGNSITINTLIDILYASADSIRRSSFAHLWFLPCYTVAVYIHFCLEKTANGRLLARVAFALVSFTLAWITQENSTYPWCVNIAFLGIFFIYSGQATRLLYEKTMKNISKAWQTAILVVTLVLYIAFSCINSGYTSVGADFYIYSMASSNYGNILLFTANSLLLVIISFSISMKIDNKFFNQLGMNTLAIYLLHIFFLGPSSRITEKILSFTGFSNIYVISLMATIITVACCYILSIIIKKHIPIIIGERKNK